MPGRVETKSTYPDQMVYFFDHCPGWFIAHNISEYDVMSYGGMKYPRNSSKMI